MTTTAHPKTTARSPLEPCDVFPPRHIGPDEADVVEMLSTLGHGSLDELIDATLPEGIRLRRALALPEGSGEHEALTEIRQLGLRNQLFRSFIGMGYSDCIT